MGVSQRGPGKLGIWSPRVEAPTIWPDAHMQRSISAGVGVGPWPFVQVRPGLGIPREGHTPARGPAPLCLPASWIRSPTRSPGTLPRGRGQSDSSFLTPHLLSHPSGACCSLLCASSHEILIKMLEHPFAHSPVDAETHLLSGVTVSMWVVGRWSGRSR